MEILSLILGIIALGVIVFVTRKYHKKWKASPKEKKKRDEAKGSEKNSLF